MVRLNTLTSLIKINNFIHVIKYATPKTSLEKSILGHTAFPLPDNIFNVSNTSKFKKIAVNTYYEVLRCHHVHFALLLK